MRFVGVVPYQAMIKTRELHMFECPNCRRTERRLVFAHSIGSFQSERMQPASTTLPLIKPAIHKIIVVSRNGMIWTFRHGIFSTSVLMEKVSVAARNAWAQTIVTFRPAASGGAAKSADPSVETSIKYDMVGSLKIAEILVPEVGRARRGSD
jgi:hypothetical protein